MSPVIVAPKSHEPSQIRGYTSSIGRKIEGTGMSNAWTVYTPGRMMKALTLRSATATRFKV